MDWLRISMVASEVVGDRQTNGYAIEIQVQPPLFGNRPLRISMVASEVVGDRQTNGYAIEIQVQPPLFGNRPLTNGRLQGQGDRACTRRITLFGRRLDPPDSSSSVPLILRWMALILPRAQAIRRPRGLVGGRRVLDSAWSGRVGFGLRSIMHICTTASFENRTQRGSSREKARNPAESLARARLHPIGRLLGKNTSRAALLGPGRS